MVLLRIRQIVVGRKKQELAFLDLPMCFMSMISTNLKALSDRLFLFNHNRHNELNLNLGLLKLSLNHSKYRANFALQAGTYSNDNYAAEPGLLKNIFEANIGISLTEKNNLWLDAGIMPLILDLKVQFLQIIGL